MAIMMIKGLQALVQYGDAMKSKTILVAFVVTLCGAVTLCWGDQASEVDFARDVGPILQRCLKCHGPEKQQGACVLTPARARCGKVIRKPGNSQEQCRSERVDSSR